MSRSVPCSTEPKTRGFATGKRLVVSRIALRFRSSISDGRWVIPGSKLVEMECNQAYRFSNYIRELQHSGSPYRSRIDRPVATSGQPSLDKGSNRE